MKRTTVLIALALVSGLLALSGGVEALERPIRALIIDGQNNHDWRATTPVLREILDEPGIFSVDVATTPEDLAAFRPDYTRYDDVVSNYNGADWPEETRKAFVDYVRAGGGFVSVHAADNSFPDWQEYNEMIGLGGWGGRSEKHGPMVYLKDGELVRDGSQGPGGSHGRQHAFQVTVHDTRHPITAGLPERWMHAEDELYSRLRGPAQNMRVLATAYDAPEMGGTGRHEPMMFTIAYGEGRVYHTPMGHDVDALRCVGFAFTLQRGTEWAATGRVTLTHVPATFPAVDEVSVWRSPAIYDSAIYDSIVTYDFGKDRTDLAAIEASIRGAPPDRLARVGEKLLGALAAPETTYAGRQFVLRMLRQIGTERCVEAVAALLTDKELSHMARFALQRLPTPAATAALREGLRHSEGDLKIGMIGSLADRGDDPAIVADLAPYLTDESKALAHATIRALGRIGSPQAATALTEAQLSDDLARARDNALLACADSLLKGGKRRPALAVYREIAEDAGRASYLRVAAYRGVLLGRRARAVPDIVKLLGADDATLREGAYRLLATAPGRNVTRAVANQIPGQGSEIQVALIRALVDRGEKGVHENVVEAASSGDAKVRLAALVALGTLCNAKTVDLLAERMMTEGDEGRAAFESLTELRGDRVTRGIVKLVEGGNAAVRLKAIDALVARRETEAVPALLEAARDDDASIRAAAFRSLGSLADAKGGGQLAAMLVGTGNPDDRQRIGEAMREIAGRVEDKEAASVVIAQAIDKADGEARVQLLGVLPVLSTETGLKAVEAQIEAEDSGISRAAVVSLASWKNPAPMHALREIVKNGESSDLRSVALKGYLRLLALPSERPALRTVELLDEALALTDDAEQRKSILTSLADFPCREALELARRHADDEGLGATASESARRIENVLLASSLVATASHGSSDTKYAFDDDRSTRWTTGTPMKPGMWFAVDIGAERSVSRILLDTRGSDGDYPRGCEVYVSFDGESWGEPVVTSPPQRPITRLVFEEPVRARFIKIVQTGETEGLFWSIHEMRIRFE